MNLDTTEDRYDAEKGYYQFKKDVENFTVFLTYLGFFIFAFNGKKKRVPLGKPINSIDDLEDDHDSNYEYVNSTPLKGRALDDTKKKINTCYCIDEIYSICDGNFFIVSCLNLVLLVVDSNGDVIETLGDYDYDGVYVSDDVVILNPSGNSGVLHWFVIADLLKKDSSQKQESENER